MKSKSFAVVIEEKEALYSVVGFADKQSRGFTVVSYANDHQHREVSSVVSDIERMAQVHGWTIVGIKHRLQTDCGSVWSTIR